MSATLWIHKSYGSDILVRFPSAIEAYNFGTTFILKHKSHVEEDTIDPWDEVYYSKYQNLNVGQTSSLQVSVHHGNFHPNGYMGVEMWNEEGTFLTTPEGVNEVDILEEIYRTPPPTPVPFLAPSTEEGVNTEYKRVVEQAKAHRLATSAFGYHPRLDAPINWSRWVTASHYDSDGSLSD